MSEYCMWGLLLLASGCTGAGLVWFTCSRISFWKAEGARVLEPGHVPPLPRWHARFIRMALGKLFVFLFIGRLRIIGKKHLKFGGRVITYANHQTERDAVLMTYMSGTRQTRYFIAKTQATGWRAPLIAFTGGIVVEHATRRGPILALMSAIGAMQKEAGTDFIIFPQGKLVPTNVLLREDFFSGIAVIGYKVSPESEEVLAYLPHAIYYDRDRTHRTLLHRTLNFFGMKNFRKFFGEVIYGAVVFIGEPIPVSCLPEDKEKATDVLFERIQTLSARAEHYAKYGKEI
jgi:1-acyl-sn-glycerol-3-phosphate acyltransferase